MKESVTVLTIFEWWLLSAEMILRLICFSIPYLQVNDADNASFMFRFQSWKKKMGTYADPYSLKSVGEIPAPFRSIFSFRFHCDILD